MSIPDPTLGLLLAHALGELPPDESAAVRRWLLVQTDERVLEAYRALQAEAELRHARLAHWAERPVRARIERALWRARTRVAAEVSLLVQAGNASRRHALSSLGPRVEAQADHRVVPVPAGATVDITLTSSTPQHLAVFAIEAGERLETLIGGKSVGPGVPVGLPGFVLEGADDVLEVYVISSTLAPIPTPAPTNGPAWIAELLEQIAARGDMTFLHCMFVPIPSADSGKQP